MKFVKYLAFLMSVVVLIGISAGRVFAASEVDSAQTEVSSFELFWPIVAGRVQGDSLYSLKLLKEDIRGFLIFSNAKKAEYYSVICSKRLVEFEDLVLVRKDFNNATKTLANYVRTQKRVIEYINKAENQGESTTEVLRVVRDTFDRQLVLLNSIAISVDDSQKEIVENSISFLSSELEKL